MATETANLKNRIGRLSYTRSTHAPLHERYVGGEFKELGESGEYGPVDPETGAAYRALGGLDHKYNRDYNIGPSYSETVFILGEGPTGESLTHDELESLLRDIGEWSDSLTPVILPKGVDRGEATWWYAFQFRPPERAPRLSRIKGRLEDTAEEVNSTRSVVNFLFY